MIKNPHSRKVLKSKLILILLIYVPNLLFGQFSNNFNLLKNYAIVSGGTLTDNNPYYAQGLVATYSLNGQNASSDSTEINASNLNNLIAEIEIVNSNINQLTPDVNLNSLPNGYIFEGGNYNFSSSIYLQQNDQIVFTGSLEDEIILNFNSDFHIAENVRFILNGIDPSNIFINVNGMLTVLNDAEIYGIILSINNIEIGDNIEGKFNLLSTSNISIGITNSIYCINSIKNNTQVSNDCYKICYTGNLLPYGSLDDLVEIWSYTQTDFIKNLSNPHNSNSSGVIAITQNAQTYYSGWPPLIDDNSNSSFFVVDGTYNNVANSNLVVVRKFATIIPGETYRFSAKLATLFAGGKNVELEFYIDNIKVKTILLSLLPNGWQEYCVEWKAPANPSSTSINIEIRQKINDEISDIGWDYAIDDIYFNEIDAIYYSQAYAGPDKDKCPNLSVPIGIPPSRFCGNNITYSWNGNDLDNNFISNPNSSINYTNEYTLTVNIDGVVTTDKMTVKMIQTPPSNININSELNIGVNKNQFRFYLGTNYGNLYTYHWDFGNGLTAEGPEVLMTNLNGIYLVTLTITNSCGISLTYPPKVYNLSAAYTNYNQNACANLGSTEPAIVAQGNNQVTNINGASTPDHMFNNITVKSGHTLNISNSIIDFNMNSRIIVEPGAVLNITNSTLRGRTTSNCSGMWQGIEVWGTANKLQGGTDATTYQGKVTIDNSTIQDAHYGVFVGRKNICNQDNLSACQTFQPIYIASSGGGIFNIQNSTFKSNGVDIYLAPYNPTSFATVYTNVLRNNNFEGGVIKDPAYKLNNTQNAINYPNNNNLIYANANTSGRTSRILKMYQINNNLKVENNNFLNSEYGIDAIDAQFDVIKHGTVSIGNNFENLKYGIVATSTITGYNYPHLIQNNRFNKISETAIHNTGTIGDNIINNKFGEGEFPPLSNYTDNPNAIYMSQSSNFTISDNTFYKHFIGVHVYNSSTGGGKINSLSEGNKFIDCKNGIKVFGNNSNLQIRCNFHDNYGNTLYENKNWNNTGNLANQGGMGNHTTAAGNEFKPVDKKHIFSSSSFQYYRHKWGVGGSLDFSVIPEIASGSTGWSNTQIINIGYQKFSNSCDPNTNPCNPDCTDLINANESEINTTQMEMNLLSTELDGGNTSLVLSDINSSNYSSTQLKSYLIANSPLSDIAMAAVLDNTNKLTELDFVQSILPNLPASNEIWDNISELFPYMSSTNVNQLILIQGLDSSAVTLTAIKRKEQKLKNERQFLLHEIVKNEVKNNTNGAASRLLLEEKENKMAAIGTLISKGDFSSAMTKINSVDLDSPEDLLWLELSNIHLNLLQNGKTWFEMTSIQDSIVKSIAISNNTMAAVNAWGILHLVYGWDIPMLEASESSTYEIKKKKINKQFASDESRFISTYPNPTNDKISISYYSNEDNLSIFIYDLFGREVHSAKLNKGYNIYVYNMSEFQSGTYILSLNGQSIKSNNVHKIIKQ